VLAAVVRGHSAAGTVEGFLAEAGSETRELLGTLAAGLGVQRDEDEVPGAAE
jgi:hypothetical protein